ncbi:MAG: hypothetical protein SCALA702_15620 [Melioribacteraceae bacterium]|nr:MAG: hypothetical protein SCALA702_15620 [Melioribacteraceae bacterium]
MPGPLLGFSYGGFNSLHNGFDDIYSDNSMPIEYFFGVGYKRIYLIGKYKTYSANGRSIVDNGDFIGSADYSQEFFMFGLRFYDQNNNKLRYFLEFGAVSSLVSETITTDNRVPELSSSEEMQEWGFGISAGATFMFTRFVGISGSVEYTRLMFDIENGYETGDVNLGGFFISAGLVFMPFSD